MLELLQTAKTLVDTMKAIDELIADDNLPYKIADIVKFHAKGVSALFHLLFQNL